MNTLRESKVIRIGLLLFFLLLIAYGIYQAGSLVWGPQITLPGNTVVVHEAHAQVRGSAVNVARLSMNGATITMTEDGLFEETVTLMPGSNRFVFTAHDKYGRSREKTLDVLYIGPPLPALRPASVRTASSTQP